ncbi:MAG: DUF87 domain-containing protein [Lachnospiraceae bacterium]|nr:DUF87 domain-containing protein [Lachnospiraceae bacterium]
MGVKNVIKKIGQTAGDKVAKLSSLSPVQVEEVQLRREEYLLEKPNPNDKAARVCTERMMAASSVEIFNAYLPQLKELYLPIKKDAEYDKLFQAEHNIRYFNITKWVTDKKENNIEKLANVYAVLSNEECNIALVFNRTQRNTNVYLAVVNTKNAGNNTDVNAYKERLMEAVRGNFPGAEWKEEGMGVIPCLKNERAYSVASASNIPTEKSEKFISQTIEKLLDGVVPNKKEKEYTIILLATPIQDVEDRKLKLGEFYSGLAPYESWQTSFQFMESSAVGAGATVGINAGVSAGIQNGQNSSITETDSTAENTSRTETENKSGTRTDSTSNAESSSDAHTEGVNESNAKTQSVNETRGTNESEAIGENKSITGGVNASVTAQTGVNFGVQSSISATVSASLSTTKGTSDTVTHGTSQSYGTGRSIAETIGKTASDTLTKGFTNTISKSVSETTGIAVANTLGRAVTKAMANTSGIAKSVNFGGNFGANFARSSTVTASVGKNEGITHTFTNFNIKHALELLENQMKRLEQSTALGMWDFAAYVLSEDQNVANNVAHTYLALTLGEESYMSKSAINLWWGNSVDKEDAEAAKEISGYLRELRHPVFGLNPAIVQTDLDHLKELENAAPEEFISYPSIITYPTITTATTSLSGKELAYSLNFPQKSVAGLPILECAEFGRNMVTFDSVEDGETIELGHIFHMNHRENNPVGLVKKSLASHTFITGSTGSGKSNTIYQILKKVRKKGVHFLIVEPAKGEYKNVFGSEKDVFVYGTNPAFTPLLRINPFRFPQGIHILEHLDRLIEIFNVCWPMYAAMPAVLKNAVEKSYTDCGWDLVRSVNKYGCELYPGFADVARNIKVIIDSSEYDTDNKGAYKGSLLTRLQSLTNGINGLIFSSDDIADTELFDQNVIVDLSRVGSSETRALIMGMLVLKLQEYRMTNATEMNSDLKHVTVLEEAHNILRRTSIEQPTEGANLLGKSVEMLSNAIAEMRTYGEGFIIADQAPGLMDMSVIRNTNTKIIMRLPDQTDRELVGKSANLNDEQIKELAKLPCGVAAVYQNEWVQPVLCKVDKYKADFCAYKFDPEVNSTVIKKNDDVSESLLKCIMNNELFQKGDKEDLRELKSLIIRSGLNSLVKIDFLNYIETEREKGLSTLRCLVYDFLKAEEAIQASTQYGDIHEWVDAVVEKLEPSVKNYSKKQIDLTMALILQEKAIRDVTYRNIYQSFTEVYKRGGGVF